MTIGKSNEDYLEAVLMIEKMKGMVRSIDVVDHLGFTKPSVSVAVKRLCDGGYLIKDEDRHLHLTKAGRKIADQIYDRHCTLKTILIFLGVDKAHAEQDACKIEHDLSEECYRAIRENGRNCRISKEELRNEAGL